MILLTSASRGTRITGMSHWYLDSLWFFESLYVAQAGWNSPSSCLRLFECWNYKSVPPCQALLFLFFFAQLGSNSGPTPWAAPPALFCDGFFIDRVSRVICPGWLLAEILLISASWIARIVGVSPALALPFSFNLEACSKLLEMEWY
jgi:hypothetical protein